MTLLEILLLLVGITIFIISYRLPAKKEEQLEETRQLAKEEITEQVNQELEHIRERIEGTVDETITYAMEKTERFMDKLTNEKMMAISQYSDSVMEDIRKDHAEVLFLYDMLNDKHENVKSAAAEVDQAVKEVRQMEKENVKNTMSQTPETVSEKRDKDVNTDTGKITETEKKTVVPEEEIKADPEIQFANMEMENRNDEILSLHREGKSNIAIAKELGMGVGEVKLVIDLFEGSKR